jgi:hypothetical protein
MIHIFPQEKNGIILHRPTAGGSGAWPRSPCSYYFSRKLKIVIQHFLFELWPSRLQPRVGPGYKMGQMHLYLLVLFLDYFTTTITLEAKLLSPICFSKRRLNFLLIISSYCSITQQHKRHKYISCLFEVINDLLFQFPCFSN